MDFIHNAAILIARILISLPFLWAGGAKVWNWSKTVDYMKSKNMPRSLLPAAVLLQLVGGLSVILGFEARIGALLLIVFIIPAAIKMHDFWNVIGDQKIVEKTIFMKDVAILGGLLLILVEGAGKFGFN